jgi:hypothetical protein
MRWRVGCLILSTFFWNSGAFKFECLGAESQIPPSEQLNQFSFHTLALAPNAGGQRAYRLEWFHDHQAWSIFDNRSLLVGSNSLKGLGYDYRLSICDSDCFWQFFTQVGGGISNGGVYGEISWGMIIPLLPIWLPVAAPKYIPGLRIDIASQFYPSRHRIITWSYPLWAGITLSF